MFGDEPSVPKPSTNVNPEEEEEEEEEQEDQEEEERDEEEEEDEEEDEEEEVSSPEIPKTTLSAHSHLSYSQEAQGPARKV